MCYGLIYEYDGILSVIKATKYAVISFVIVY